VIERLPQILPFLDWELAKLVENHVRAKAADVITDNGVAAFLGENGQLTGVKLINGTELPCELAIIATGVKPNVTLAQAAGLHIGELGGIAVDKRMRTSDPDIYAVGDCVENVNLLTGRTVLAPYGDIANLHGRVAGQNVVQPDSAEFPGIIQTGICKIFDFTIGFTGLSEHAARALGYEVSAACCAGLDIPGFMQGKLLVSKLVADHKTGQILGFQSVGPGDVSKRVATMAIAIRGKLSVTDLCYADLPYAPPYSLALDHTIVAAHVLENKMLGRMEGISVVEVKRKIDAKEPLFLLDTRSPQEFEQMRLGIGETLIPLGALRNRLNELPQDRDVLVIVFCKISLRGYEAVGILQAHGWHNVKVMEGGMMAWPYPREK